MAGCGDDAEREKSRPSAPDPPAAETPAETPAETSTKAAPAERAADALERLYPDALASTGRTAAERERIRREVASYTTLEASCSPTQRKRVFNCSLKYAPRGYAPNIDHLRVTLSPSGRIGIESR